MFTGRVIGTVVATTKDRRLVGSKLLIVQPLNLKGEAEGYALVAVDSVGAGAGERVLVVTGSPARLAAMNADAPVDAAIVGIVDSVEIVSTAIASSEATTDSRTRTSPPESQGSEPSVDSDQKTAK